MIWGVNPKGLGQAPPAGKQAAAIKGRLGRVRLLQFVCPVTRVRHAHKHPGLLFWEVLSRPVGAAAGAGIEGAPCTMVDLGILSRLGLGIRNSPGYPFYCTNLFLQLPQNSESEGEGGRAAKNPLS